MPGIWRRITRPAALCLLAALLWAAVFPMAGAAGAPAPVTLPAEIAQALSGPAWDGWQPVAINEEARESPWSDAAVLMRREGRNALVMLRREGGPFVPTLVTGLAVYQGGIHAPNDAG